MNSFFEKYGLLTHGIRRTYLVPLDKRVYGYERATIVNLIVEDLSLKDVSWKFAIYQLVKYLQDKYKKPLEFLYNFKIEWARGRIFGPDKFQILCEKIEEGLWVNISYASVHGIMLIQDLLKLYEIELSKCRLEVHLPSMSEPIEVIKYYKDKIKIKFKEYLLDENLSENATQTIIQGVETMNKALIRMNAGANDFYLMDNRTTLSTCKSNALLYLHNNHIYNEKQMQLARKILNYYSNFFSEYEISMLKEEI